MTKENPYLSGKQTFLAVLLTCFCYLAISYTNKLILMLPGYYVGLWLITKSKNIRIAFYSGLAAGFTISAVHLRFFYNIFQEASIVLWLILALWLGLFCAFSRFLRNKLNKQLLCFTIPALHFIFEYFTSELYPLKFSWLNTGFFTYFHSSFFLISVLGMYGFSLTIFILTSTSFESKKRNLYLSLISASLLALIMIPKKQPQQNINGPIVSGIQLEFPDEKEVLGALNKTIITYPQTDIFLMSEYTFLDEIPKEIKEWCKLHQKYLICGSKIFTDPSQTQFRNSATVVNPQGEVEFTQTKSVPIQFFDDGIPAQNQKIWNSPWGKIGLCICYDLSYSRVTDELISQGAQALIVPTMDVISWGENQHKLHSRVGPVKATEYNIPIFKVSSSGISQFIDSKGNILDSAPYPGQGEMLSARLPLVLQAHQPVDRFLFYPLVIVLSLIVITKYKKS